jgi:hypothetical protein
VRIVTPAAGLLRVPVVRDVVRRVERRLADTKAAYVAGFYVTVLRKDAG